MVSKIPWSATSHVVLRFSARGDFGQLCFELALLPPWMTGAVALASAIPDPKSCAMATQSEERKRAHAPSRREVQQTPTILRRRASCWAVLIVGLAACDGTTRGQP